MKVDKVWLTEDAVWIRMDDGTEACERFKDYPRLKHASRSVLENYDVDDYGIHWGEIDEDLSFEGFLSKKERSRWSKVSRHLATKSHTASFGISSTVSLTTLIRSRKSMICGDV